MSDPRGRVVTLRKQQYDPADVGFLNQRLYGTGEWMLMDAQNLRVGLGTDLHRLATGRPLMLGGVDIPFDRGAVGHSDADVLLHALIDAILGATGKGDIGERYPNTDPNYAGADSRKLLAEVWSDTVQAGWTLINLDCVISAERPKLGGHKSAIRSSLADQLGIPVSQINVKAKSGERVGPVGRGEAIAAEVVVLMLLRNSQSDADSDSSARRGS